MINLVLFGNAPFATSLALQSALSTRPTWSVLHGEPLNHGTQLRDLRQVLGLPDLDGGMQGIQLFRYLQGPDPKGDLLMPTMSPMESNMKEGSEVYVLGSVTTPPSVDVTFGSYPTSAPVPILLTQTLSQIPHAVQMDVTAGSVGGHTPRDMASPHHSSMKDASDSVMSRLRQVSMMSTGSPTNRANRAATRRDHNASGVGLAERAASMMIPSPMKRVPYTGGILFGACGAAIGVSKDKRSAIKAKGGDGWDSTILASGPISGGTVRMSVRVESKTDLLPYVMLGVVEASDETRAGLDSQKMFTKGWFFSVVDGQAYSLRAPGPVLSRRDYFFVKNGVVGLVLDMDEGTLRIEHNGADQGISLTGITCPEVYFCVEIYSSGTKVEITT